MYNNDWIKELNESYKNIQNVNEVVLTEEQINEHLMQLAIIVESIERTFDIELTEEEIDQIDEQLQLNEFIGVLLRLGATAAKRGLGVGLKAAGKAGQTGYKASRAKAIADAAKATEDAAAKARAAWKAGGMKGTPPLVKPIKPNFKKKGFFTRTAQKAEMKGKEWTPQFKDAGGNSRGFVGSTVRQAGYKSGWQATKAGAKQTAQALGTLATGGIAGYTLGNLLKGPEDKDHKKKRGESSTKRGDVGEYDTDWETESGRSRPTGVRVPVREDYVEGISTFTNSIVENVYEVKLSDSIKKDIRQNIEFSILANS